MLLKLTHQTDLQYSELISESVMELHMAPRQEQDQHRLAFSLAVGPPTAVSSYFDWLGNIVHSFSISAAHKQIRIIATSVVETDRPRHPPEKFRDTWPIPAAAFDYAAYDFLQFTGPIIDDPQIRKLAELLSPTDGMSMGELALRMLHLIDDKFAYRPGVTSASSPITDVLRLGSGVCQDFAHLMIALARTLNIPARYVSGLLHPDAKADRGYTQTHAWCELWFPTAGWVGFDAANHRLIGGNCVKVAVGRSFDDVPPNRGVYRGGGEESIAVTVQSEELAAIPSELAAERFISLSIPTFPAAKAPGRMIFSSQTEQ